LEVEVESSVLFWAPGPAFMPQHHVIRVIPGDKETNMTKKQLALLLALVLTIPAMMAVFAQQASAQAKKARVEGFVMRSSMEKSALTVHDEKTNSDRTVTYDSSTKWVSQYHGDKKVNDIDRGQVKDGDYVICMGAWDKSGGELHATTISKRLSHSPKP
jgi:hypothetical protein